MFKARTREEALERGRRFAAASETDGIAEVVTLFVDVDVADAFAISRVLKREDWAAAQDLISRRLSQRIARQSAEVLGIDPIDPRLLSEDDDGASSE